MTTLTEDCKHFYPVPQGYESEHLLMTSKTDRDLAAVNLCEVDPLLQVENAIYSFLLPALVEFPVNYFEI
jgi:hypothetical protein